MKYFVLSLVMLFNVLFSIYQPIEYKTNIEERNIDFDCSKIEFVFDKNCFNEELFISTIKITRLKESSSNFEIYLSIINDGFIYSYNDNPTLKFSKKIDFLNYNFTFSINKEFLVNNFKFKIEYSYLDSFNTIFIPFSSDYLLSSNCNTLNVYYKAILNNNILKIYNSLLDFKYIELFKYQLYYDFLKFKYLKVDISGEYIDVTNCYFEIEDKNRVFKDISIVYDFEYSIFPLNYRIDGNTYEFYNNETFYLNQESFLESKNMSEFYNYPTKNIYFPTSYYESFKNSNCSLIIELNSYLFLKYDFLLTIENNARNSGFSIIELNEAIKNA